MKSLPESNVSAGSKAGTGVACRYIEVQREDIAGGRLRPLREFRAHDKAILTAAFHPALPILATGSGDLSIRIWDLHGDQAMRHMGVEGTSIGRLAMSPTGSHLYAAGGSPTRSVVGSASAV